MILPGVRDGVHVFHNGHLEEPLGLTNSSGVEWLTDYRLYGELNGESGSVAIGNPGTTSIRRRTTKSNIEQALLFRVYESALCRVETQHVIQQE